MGETLRVVRTRMVKLMAKMRGRPAHASEVQEYNALAELEAKLDELE